MITDTETRIPEIHKIVEDQGTFKAFNLTYKIVEDQVWRLGYKEHNTLLLIEIPSQEQNKRF